MLIAEEPKERSMTEKGKFETKGVGLKEQQLNNERCWEVWGWANT